MMQDDAVFASPASPKLDLSSFLFLVKTARSLFRYLAVAIRDFSASVYDKKPLTLACEININNNTQVSCLCGT